MHSTMHRADSTLHSAQHARGDTRRSAQQNAQDEIMKRIMLATTLALDEMAIGIDGAQAADQLVLDRNAAIQFATLPDGVRFPEGITANPATGDIFVATFDFGPNANKFMRFSKSGQLSAIKDFDGTPMLGLEFDSA